MTSIYMYTLLLERDYSMNVFCSFTLLDYESIDSNYQDFWSIFSWGQCLCLELQLKHIL